MRSIKYFSIFLCLLAFDVYAFDVIKVDQAVKKLFDGFFVNEERPADCVFNYSYESIRYVADLLEEAPVFELWYLLDDVEVKIAKADLCSSSDGYWMMLRYIDDEYKVIGYTADAFNELQHRFVNPTGQGVRGCDKQGCGEYQANREGRTGRHLGADYISDPGQEVVAIADGTVARLPSGDYDDIVVGDGKGVSYKLLYLNVDKSLEIGSTVTAGQVLGTAQDITGRYPGITNHVHVKLRVDSNVVNPEDYIEPP